MSFVYAGTLCASMFNVHSFTFTFAQKYLGTQQAAIWIAGTGIYTNTDAHTSALMLLNSHITWNLWILMFHMTPDNSIGYLILFHRFETSRNFC